jgi:hypothetical protein
MAYLNNQLGQDPLAQFYGARDGGLASLLGGGILPVPTLATGRNLGAVPRAGDVAQPAGFGPVPRPDVLRPPPRPGLPGTPPFPEGPETVPPPAPTAPNNGVDPFAPDFDIQDAVAQWEADQLAMGGYDSGFRTPGSTLPPGVATALGLVFPGVGALAALGNDRALENNRMALNQLNAYYGTGADQTDKEPWWIRMMPGFLTGREETRPRGPAGVYGQIQKGILDMPSAVAGYEKGEVTGHPDIVQRGTVGTAGTAQQQLDAFMASSRGTLPEGYPSAPSTGLEGAGTQMSIEEMREELQRTAPGQRMAVDPQLQAGERQTQAAASRAQIGAQAPDLTTSLSQGGRDTSRAAIEGALQMAMVHGQGRRGPPLQNMVLPPSVTPAGGWSPTSAGTVGAGSPPGIAAQDPMAQYGDQALANQLREQMEAHYGPPPDSNVAGQRQIAPSFEQDAYSALDRAIIGARGTGPSIFEPEPPDLGFTLGTAALPNYDFQSFLSPPWA